MDMTTARMAQLELIINSQQQEIDALKAEKRSRVYVREEELRASKKNEVAELQTEVGKVLSLLITEQGISKDLKEKNAALESKVTAEFQRANRAEGALRVVPSWQRMAGATFALETIMRRFEKFFKETGRGILNPGVAAGVVDAIMDSFVCDESGCTQDALKETEIWKKMRPYLHDHLGVVAQLYADTRGGSTSLSERVRELQVKIDKHEQETKKTTETLRVVNLEIQRLKEELCSRGGPDAPRKLQKYGKAMEAEMV